jgi:hypothetical protein
MAVVLLVSHSAGAAVFITCAGLVFNLSARQWILPYVLLDSCAVVLLPGLFWAWDGWHLPGEYWRRMSRVMLVYSEAIVAALGVSIIKLGIVPGGEALTWEIPFMAIGAALACLFASRAMRPLHSAGKNGSSRRVGPETQPPSRVPPIDERD